MNTVSRRIEVCEIVRHTLLDAFTMRIAYLIIAATPEHARDGTFYRSEETIILALTDKHVTEFSAEWMLADEGCLDLLDGCVLRLIAGIAKKHAKDMKEALKSAWAGAMEEARAARAEFAASGL
jgi:hypothetical protein